MPLSRASQGARRPGWRLPLVLALGVWLCTLPLVGIAVALGLPWQTAWLLLSASLAVALAVCLVLCRTTLRAGHQHLDALEALQARGDPDRIGAGATAMKAEAPAHGGERDAPTP